MQRGQPGQAKDLQWTASSMKDFRTFPDDVQDEAGYDLWLVQQGRRPSTAKVLRGFGGADVLELVENYDRDTYRVVYTVRFTHAIYVLHAFQKKSKRGTKTPQKELDLVKSRLQLAAEDYARRYSDEAKNQNCTW